jgi:uncharacterized protein (UPF0332 family)
VAKDLEQSRLKQAREALDAAQALMAGLMDTGHILTSLYYAFYYAILASMNEGQVPTTMQSVTIGLFEQQYILTGLFKKEYGAAVRRMYSVKPACSGEMTTISGEEMNELAVLAGAFIQDVEAHLEKTRADLQEGIMASNDRRTGKNNVVRSGSDRRVKKDPGYTGPERRVNEERRTGKDRRKKS